MASEINALAHQLNTFSERNRHYRDFTLNSLVHAIREIIAAFPVYRTYVPAGAARSATRSPLHRVAPSTRRSAATPRDRHVFDFIRNLLLKEADYIPDRRTRRLRAVRHEVPADDEPGHRERLEDTALYVYNRLVSLNEVGGEPSRFGTPPSTCMHGSPTGRGVALGALGDLHARHEAKRGRPRAHRRALGDPRRLEARARPRVARRPAPQRARRRPARAGSQRGIPLYQTLLGAWPLEALDGDPTRSSWTHLRLHGEGAARGQAPQQLAEPVARVGRAVTSFIAPILDPGAGRAFLDALPAARVRVAHAGMWNSLAQRSSR